MTFPPELFQQIKSILLVPYNYDPIGDAVMAVTHLRQLNALFPQAKLSFVTVDNNVPLLQASGMDIEHISPAIFNTVDIVECYHRWDLIICTAPVFFLDQFALYHYLAPNLILINYEGADFLNSFEKGKKISLPNFDIYCNPPEPSCHMTELISQSVIGKNAPTPRVYLPPHPLTPTITKEMWQPDRLRVLLSPIGARKQIPPAEFAEILSSIDPQLLPKIDFLLLHAKNIQEYYEQLVSSPCLNGVNIRLSPKTTVEQYLALVDSSEFVISVDTSSVHLATAYDKPLASFYSNCAAKFALWRPIPNNAPTLIALGANPAENELDTANFNHQAVQQWINQQLTQLIAEKNL